MPLQNVLIVPKRGRVLLLYGKNISLITKVCVFFDFPSTLEYLHTHSYMYDAEYNMS